MFKLLFVLLNALQLWGNKKFYQAEVPLEVPTEVSYINKENRFELTDSSIVIHPYDLYYYALCDGGHMIVTGEDHRDFTYCYYVGKEKTIALPRLDGDFTYGAESDTEWLFISSLYRRKVAAVNKTTLEVRYSYFQYRTSQQLLGACYASGSFYLYGQKTRGDNGSFGSGGINDVTWFIAKLDNDLAVEKYHTFLHDRVFDMCDTGKLVVAGSSGFYLFDYQLNLQHQISCPLEAGNFFAKRYYIAPQLGERATQIISLDDYRMMKDPIPVTDFKHLYLMDKTVFINYQGEQLAVEVVGDVSFKQNVWGTHAVLYRVGGGDFEDEITIPLKTNVKSRGIYPIGFRPNFNGDGFLNGLPIERNVSITEPGHYELEIVGQGVKQTFEFEVSPQQAPFEAPIIHECDYRVEVGDTIDLNLIVTNCQLVKIVDANDTLYQFTQVDDRVTVTIPVHEAGYREITLTGHTNDSRRLLLTKFSLFGLRPTDDFDLEVDDFRDLVTLHFKSHELGKDWRGFVIVTPDRRRLSYPLNIPIIDDLALEGTYYVYAVLDQGLDLDNEVLLFTFQKGTGSSFRLEHELAEYNNTYAHSQWTIPKSELLQSIVYHEQELYEAPPKQSRLWLILTISLLVGCCGFGVFVIIKKVKRTH